MIACAQCGKKSKDDATVCKYCGYNPSALQASNMQWGYQQGAYPSMQYQPPVQQGVQYYDANGKAYNVRYDYKVVPVDEDEEEDEENDSQQMLLYPYNPTLVQQPTQPMERERAQQKNVMAWIGYILAMFVDILAWPFCLIGLAVAKKRDDANKEVCEGGMLFTLMRLVTALCLFLVWWGVSTYLPGFFVGAADWKVAVAKIVLFGWPVAVGSIFSELSADGSALKLAGKGYFYFSLIIAVVGVIFFDITLLPIFS